MPAPSHRPVTFNANRIFTDRDDAKALFIEQLTAQQQQDEYRVLNFSGIGGQGKSALCGQFEKHLSSTLNGANRQLAWAKVNFEDSNKRDSIAALLALRMQLADNGKIWFPAFDTAFARYFAITQCGRKLETTHPELFRQPHDILQGFSSVAEGVSGIPLLGDSLKLVYKLGEKLRITQWMERRGSGLLQGLESFAPHELKAKLPVYFAADVDDWLHHETNTPARRVVLLYDTYEALWRDRPSKIDPLVDGWVRQLVAETPAVLHTILGRDPLAWAERDPYEWQSIIIPYLLDRLSDADAEHFLQSVPIAEAEIRSRIVQSAKGIPFYLNLQVDQYEDCKRRGGTPQVEDYGGKEPDILTRFTNHLPDNLRRALAVAAFPRWLDEALFLNLCQAFLGGAAAVSFADLTAYSFWTKQDGRYYLHTVMRDYQQTESREHEQILFRQIHTHLFDYYRLPQTQSNVIEHRVIEQRIIAFDEATYHHSKTELPAITDWKRKEINDLTTGIGLIELTDPRKAAILFNKLHRIEV